jgi:hypothetical protein
MTHRWGAVLIGLLTGASGSVTHAAHPDPRGASPDACRPDPETARWIERAVVGWEVVSRDALLLSAASPPWMVFYDATCAWHVGAEAGFDPASRVTPTGLAWNGAPLEVRAVAHSGEVALPDGSRWPAASNTARASFFRGTAATLFVVATPAAWRRDPAIAAGPDVDEFFLGVTLHELTHTRHLPLVIERLKALAARRGLSSLALDDDVVQTTFGGDAAFRAAFETERDLFYAAAATVDREQRRATIRRALDAANIRRSTHFTGDKAHYRELEDVFLAMEGAGQWAAYVFARRTRPPAEALSFVRANKKYWSQEEGLALFLLLDLEVPDWQRDVFSAGDVGPFALLERALAPSR